MLRISPEFVAISYVQTKVFTFHRTAPHLLHGVGGQWVGLGQGLVVQVSPGVLLLLSPTALTILLSPHLLYTVGGQWVGLGQGLVVQVEHLGHVQPAGQLLAHLGGRGGA